MLDANTDYEDEGLMQFVQQAQLLDLHEDLHSTTIPETYRRGICSLDYILGTGKVSASLVKGGKTTFEEAGLTFSDYRAFFIDIKEEYF